MHCLYRIDRETETVRERRVCVRWRWIAGQGRSNWSRTSTLDDRSSKTFNYNGAAGPAARPGTSFNSITYKGMLQIGKVVLTYNLC